MDISVLNDIGSACSIIGLIFSIFTFAYSNRRKKVSRLPQTDDSPVVEDADLDC